MAKRITRKQKRARIHLRPGNSVLNIRTGQSGIVRGITCTGDSPRDCMYIRNYNWRACLDISALVLYPGDATITHTNYKDLIVSITEASKRNTFYNRLQSGSYPIWNWIDSIHIRIRSYYIYRTELKALSLLESRYGPIYSHFLKRE